MHRVLPLLACSILLSASLAGCSAVDSLIAKAKAPSAPAPPAARVELRPTSGYQVTGIVDFSLSGDQVEVFAEVNGLPPNSIHGFHIHERGDCSAPDATSAGAHFNPGGAPHGAPDHGEHHAGDLPNLKADGDGVAHLRFRTRALTIDNGPNGILGRAVIVHRDADDYASQPAGNSGPRIACGLIEPEVNTDD